MNKNFNIFVYGSLREGFFNYDKYLEGKIISKKLGTVKGTTLYHMPYKGYPAILTGNESVIGEILTIDPKRYDETISELDQMEGFLSIDNPKNEYDKKLILVDYLDETGCEECYIYFYNKDIDNKFDLEAEKVHSGNWKDYMLNRNI